MIGFDDSRGDLYLTKHDHTAYRYEIIALLGKGSFGQVECFDHKRIVFVALKIIKNKSRYENRA
jgi:dual specificity tyrosine-phosphorylation-regulated kinase 2/3/4